MFLFLKRFAFSIQNLFKANRRVIHLTLGLLLLDLFSKFYIVQTYSLYETCPILSCFSITYVLNTGSVWGFFRNSSVWLAYLGLIIVLLLLISLRKVSLPHFGSKLAYAGMLAGILGNTLDRFFRPGVIDFLDFYYKNHHWPCFNFADICICLSCIYFIFFQKK